MEKLNKKLRQRVVTRDFTNPELKRGHSSDSEGDESKQRKTEDNTRSVSALPTPLFLTVKHKEEGKSLSKVSPFLINKALTGAGGEPNAIRKLRNGTILVEAKNERQAQQFLKMKSFYDQVEILVEAHSSLNSSKGIVFSRDLLECTIEELKEELKSASVTDIARITRSENGVLKPTAGLILTFATPHPPESIKAGYLSLSVRPYYRNPQRCYKCQKFGHNSKSCPNREVCCRCGQAGHDDKVCSNEELCVNCRGKHAANSKACKVYMEEKEVLKICTDEKLSFVEARKLYKSRQVSLPKGATSYSQVAAASSRPPQCSSCQVLEGMVRALTEQVSLLVSQLGTITNPNTTGPSSKPSPDPNSLAKQSTRQLAPQKTHKSPPTTSVASLYLKGSQPPARKGLTAEERRSLSDKLKNKIQRKVESRSKSSINPSPPSSHSSQVSILQDEMEEDDPTTISKESVVGSRKGKHKEIKFT